MSRLDGQRFADLTLSIINILKQNRFIHESYTDTFLRLIGLIPNVDIGQIKNQAGDLSGRTQQKIQNSVVGTGQDKRVATGQAGNTVIDGFLKSQDDNLVQMRQFTAAYIENLISFVHRWGRLQRGQQFRRIQRLIGNVPVDPFNPTLIGALPLQEIQLHTSHPGAKGTRIESVNIAETIRKINEGLKEIETSKINRSSGKLTLQLSLYNLVVQQLSFLISNIPQDRLGELGGALISTIKAPLVGIDATARKLASNRRALGVELTKLQEQSALIIDGTTLETGETLSLLNILQALLYLTSKLQYKCKNCKFLQQGKQIGDLVPGITRENATFGAICTFASNDGTGKPTQPNFSCKEVWNLVDNDYWTANDDVIQNFKDQLKPKKG